MIDTSEVSLLAEDLSHADGRIQTQAEKVAKKSALEIKRGMQRIFTGHGHAPYVQQSLEFEAMGGGLSYRIGELDSAGHQWGIAAILAFGTSNNAPVVEHTRPLYEEVPKVEHYLGEAGEQAVLGP